MHGTLSISPSFALGFSPHRLHAPRRKGAHRQPVRVAAKVEQLLQALRKAGRRSLLIVQTHCGDGHVANAAARRARALGFVAIEVRGFDADAEAIGKAWADALVEPDPAIGVEYRVTDDDSHLPVEDHEADLVLCAHDDAEAHRICANPKAVVLTGGDNDDER